MREAIIFGAVLALGIFVGNMATEMALPFVWDAMYPIELLPGELP